MADGIGDTIRVSLTEAPEFEMPVAQMLLNHFNQIKDHDQIDTIQQNPLSSFEYKKRDTNTVLNIGSKNVPVVSLSKYRWGDTRVYLAGLDRMCRESYLSARDAKQIALLHFQQLKHYEFLE